MAIRQIGYTVDSSGITPAVRQDGGVQGDHRITDLKFDIGKDIFDNLERKANSISDGKVYYYFEMYNGEGDTENTLPQELVSSTVVFPLEEWITRYGGIIKTVLCLTVGSDTETLQEIYSYPAVLTLKSRPTGSEPNKKNYQSMALMSAQTAKAAKQAAEDAESAAASAEIAENYATMFEDAEVIFKSDLEDDGQPLPMDLVIDDHLSKESTNPVQNRVIAEALEGMAITVDAYLSEESTNPPENRVVTEEFKKFKDRIIEYGKEGMWFYEKRESGICNLWGHTKLMPNECHKIGSMYYSEAFTLVFPFVVGDRVITGNTGSLSILTNMGSGDKYQTTDLRIMSAREFTEADKNSGVSVNISVHGTWKDVVFDNE